MHPARTYPEHCRAILKLGLPLIGGHLAQTAIGVTDTVMLGRYSVEALAAVTLGSTYFFILFIVGSGFAWAVMPLVASFSAEGDETGVRRATRMGLWLSFAFSLLALPAMIWSAPILQLLGQDPGVAQDAGSYLAIAGFGIIPGLLVMVLKSYLAAIERTQVVLAIALIAVVFNVVFNYALIFGNWGAPELGIVGAAIASVITHVVSLIGVVIYTQASLTRHALFQRLWRGDRQMLVRVFQLGWPIGLTSLTETGLFAASALMMGWLGTLSLAAHGVAVQLAFLTFMVHVGLANVATIRAGNAYGRRDPQQMERGAIAVTGMSVLFAMMTMAVFVLFPESLLSFFIQPDDPRHADIVMIGVGLLAVAALFQLVDGAQIIALSLLRGVQDTRVPMFLAAVSYWGVGLPASYVFGFLLGWEGIGVWFGLVLGLSVAGALLSFRFWARILRHIKARQCRPA